MADGTTDSWEMIERWRAEHPEYAGGPSAPPPPPRRLVPVPTPDPKVAAAQQREMLERWRQDHPHVAGLIAGTPTALQAQRVAAERNRVAVEDRETFDLDSTPLTVLGAFIVGCIFGGIVMVIITGIAFWGFAG